MNILIFGATGMVGQGVLREALRADDVKLVQTIGRSATGVTHAKLRDVLHADLIDYTPVEGQLTGFDACFFCLGASTVGMEESGYTRINYEIPLAAGRVLSRLNPEMSFAYVSGAGTGSQSAMWARVKRRTEDALLALPFKAAYMFRPGVIQPLHGARSKTRLYHAFYVATSPLLSLARRLFPAYVLSTEDIGIAMLNAARHGTPKPRLESADIRALLSTR
jgi:uncharacterized protein YbjT (DUF2867 family)